MNSRSHLSFDGFSTNRQQLLVQLKICAARLMGPRCFLNTKALFVFTFQFFAIPTSCGGQQKQFQLALQHAMQLFALNSAIARTSQITLFRWKMDEKFS
ncbi:hypothetical protein T02_2506 [Trichinella nativa]|uniref:Uncharacterized protein n=1 Tax=Trichinella nativa TaxID=6335 RepID=A0A0V1LBV9_9BILA|nr:hypothetical protein T02_2506 [Trichinella nativa]